MGSELLERARELRSTIDAAGAAAAETGSTALPQELVNACFEAGLYGTLAPRAVGGAELPIDDCLEVFAEVSYADGSVGWSLMAGATGACFFGAYCPDSFTDQDVRRRRRPRGGRPVRSQRNGRSQTATSSG